MDIYYKDFFKKTLKASIMFVTLVNLLIFFALSSIARTTNYYVLLILFLTVPVSFLLIFKFMINTPAVNIIRSRKNIEAEITSAIRFFILDLKANAPVFEALQNIVKNFDEIGLYLNDAVTKVKLGDSLSEALNQTVELVPSESFRTFIWQIINHLQTGTDITKTLNVIVYEIVERQKIEFKKFGKKLNVLSLFYMIIAIILPTIGFTMISAMLIFIGVTMNLSLILGFWVLFTMLQIVFLVMSTGNKPVMEA